MKVWKTSGLSLYTRFLLSAVSLFTIVLLFTQQQLPNGSGISPPTSAAWRRAGPGTLHGAATRTAEDLLDKSPRVVYNGSPGMARDPRSAAFLQTRLAELGAELVALKAKVQSSMQRGRRASSQLNSLSSEIAKTREELDEKRKQANTDSCYPPPSKSLTRLRGPELVTPSGANVFQRSIISWTPRIVIFRNFLSEEETDHIMQIVNGKLTRSKVVSEKETVTAGRTSHGQFLANTMRTSVIQEIEQRIANATFVKPENGESIYVLRYQEAERYDPHTDFCRKNNVAPDESCVKFMKRGKDRVGTFIMSIRPAEDGGELSFPNFSADGLPMYQGFSSAQSQGGPDNAWVSSTNARASLTRRRRKLLQAGTWGGYCDKPGMFKLKLARGDALLFWNYHPNGTSDPLALHGGCPVKTGEKWIATRWLRQEKFV